MDIAYVSLVALLAATTVGSILFAVKASKSKLPVTVNVSSSLEKIKEMGELVVLSAYVKEVVHVKVGEDKWFRTSGKMLLICKFEVEFRYDMASTQILREGTAGLLRIAMPPHRVKISAGLPELYHEDKSVFLGIFNSDIDPATRNSLNKVAEDEVKKIAGKLSKELEPKIRASAELTLRRLADSFGHTQPMFTFDDHSKVVVDIKPLEQEQKAA